MIHTDAHTTQMILLNSLSLLEESSTLLMNNFKENKKRQKLILITFILVLFLQIIKTKIKQKTKLIITKLVR